MKIAKKKWDETRFYEKNEALRNVEHPLKKGKIISTIQYSEIRKLIKYRNYMSHKDYYDLDREKGIREVENAYSTLVELCEIINELKDIDEDLEPIKEQKITLNY